MDRTRPETPDAYECVQGAISIGASLKIGSGRRSDWIELARPFVELTRGEQGCLAFFVGVDPYDGDRVTVFEAFKDVGAFQLHIQSDHFKSFALQSHGIEVVSQAFGSVAAAPFDLPPALEEAVQDSTDNELKPSD